MITDAELASLNAEVERIRQQQSDRLSQSQAEIAAQVAVPEMPAFAASPEDIARTFAELRATVPAPTAAQESAFEWREHTLPRLKANGVPERYRYRVEQWNCEGQEVVFRSLGSILGRNGAIAALVGERGAGKTVIASQTILRIIDQDYQRMFVQCLPGVGYRYTPYRKMSDIISRIKPLYADFGTIDPEAIERSRTTYATCPLLVIDEIHDCEDQRMRDRILVDLLDRRYAGMVDTIIISNQTPKEFKQTTPTSVLSRISENGVVIPCEWGSWRGGERRALARTSKGNP